MSPYVYPQNGGTCETVKSCMREDLNRIISQLASSHPGYEQYPKTNPEVSYIKQNRIIFWTHFLTANNSLSALGIDLMPLEIHTLKINILMRFLRWIFKNVYWSQDLSILYYFQGFKNIRGQILSLKRNCWPSPIWHLSTWAWLD